MHEELGTGPGFFYLWDRAVEAAAANAPARERQQELALAGDGE